MQNEFLIHILKQQPRQGRRADPNDDPRKKSGKAEETRKAIEKLTEPLDDLNSILTAINNAVFQVGTTLDGFTKIATDAFEPFRKLITGTSDLARGITQIDGVFAGLSKRFIDANKSAFALENRYKKVTQSFKLGQTAAANFSVELDKYAERMGIGSETTYELISSLDELGGPLIASAKKGLDDLIETQFMFQQQLGVKSEAAQGMELYLTSLGKTKLEFMQQSEQLKQITGMQNAHSVIAEEIGSMAADTQFQYGRMPGSLELAVLKSKALGLSMENLAATGKSLLNIEQSVGSELEYQLLSGRRLVDDKNQSLTNAYRMATIQGDANKQAEIMNRLLKTEGDTIKTNMFARQKLAETLGMDERTLAKAVQQRAISEKYQIANFSELIGKTAEEIQAATGATGKNLQEIVAAADTRTGEERLIEELQNLANVMRLDAEKFGKGRATEVTSVSREAIEAAKEFKKVTNELVQAAPALGIMNKIVQPTQEYLNALTDFGKFIPLFEEEINKTIKTVQSYLNKITGTAAGGVEKDGKDIFIPGGGSSTQIVTGGFGEFTRYNLDPRDDVLAAPGIRNALAQQQGGSIDTNILASVIANAIKQGIERAKITATIRTDDIYSGNILNNPRY